MTDERRDPPIDEQPFVGGVTVIDFGEVRVSRGLSRRSSSSCPHNRLSYDRAERRVWCRDCERDVEGFDAFCILAEQSDAVAKSLERRAKMVREAEAASLISVAARAMDKAWRSRTMVPACPHCGHGLFPEHMRNLGHVGKEYARARIAKAKGGRNDG